MMKRAGRKIIISESINNLVNRREIHIQRLMNWLIQINETVHGDRFTSEWHRSLFHQYRFGTIPKTYFNLIGELEKP